MPFEPGTAKLLFETDGPVAVVTINRPEVRNALDNETADALTAALRAFDRDDALRCCVLTGAG
ncbi:MAG: enoyl-CoA hydratase-related protein, partial [Alphaproteobacteria bacterium]